MNKVIRTSKGCEIILFIQSAENIPKVNNAVIEKAQKTTNERNAKKPVINNIPNRSMTFLRKSFMNHFFSE